MMNYEKFSVERNGPPLVGSASPMYLMNLSEFNCAFSERTVLQIPFMLMAISTLILPIMGAMENWGTNWVNILPE